MVLVVLLHSYNLEVNFKSKSVQFNGGVNFFVQTFFGQGITKVAVPIFFTISGYLFFLNFQGHKQDFIIKYKKRAQSLLIPYLFWSLWALLLFFSLQQLPYSQSFFSNEKIINYSLEEVLSTIFLNPLAYQLWFIRDLMVLVIISPIIFWSLQKAGKLVLLALLTIWFAGRHNISFLIFSSEAILFFCVGAYLSIHKSNFLLKNRNFQYSKLLFSFWILLVLIRTFMLFSEVDKETFLWLFFRLNVLVGTISFWFIYDTFMPNKGKLQKQLLSLSYFSFFLFAFHEPILTIFKKGLFYLLGTTELSALAIYFLAPLLTIVLSIMAGRLMKKYFQSLYFLVTGGR